MKSNLVRERASFDRNVDEKIEESVSVRLLHQKSSIGHTMELLSRKRCGRVLRGGALEREEK